jgi:hypothetical protein
MPKYVIKTRKGYHRTDGGHTNTPVCATVYDSQSEAEAVRAFRQIRGQVVEITPEVVEEATAQARRERHRDMMREIAEDVANASA